MCIRTVWDGTSASCSACGCHGGRTALTAAQCLHCSIRAELPETGLSQFWSPYITKLWQPLADSSVCAELSCCAALRRLLLSTFEMFLMYRSRLLRTSTSTATPLAGSTAALLPGFGNRRLLTEEVRGATGETCPLPG